MDLMGTKNTNFRPWSTHLTNDLTEEKGHRVLRQRLGWITGRDKQTARMVRQRGRPIQEDAEGANRAKQKVVVETSRKIG